MKKITFEIACLDGKKQESGYALTKHFVVTKERTRSWVMTHLPTGLMVPFCTTTSFADALVLAKKIERLHDWSRNKRESEIPLKARYAVLRAAKGNNYADRWLVLQRAKAQLAKADKRVQELREALK